MDHEKYICGNTTQKCFFGIFFLSQKLYFLCNYALGVANSVTNSYRELICRQCCQFRYFYPNNWNATELSSFDNDSSKFNSQNILSVIPFRGVN